MTGMAQQPTSLGVAVRGRIAAPPELLWAIIGDPTRHPDLAGSGEPQETWLLTDGPLQIGSRFKSRQKLGPFRYHSVSQVTACQPPHLLRWLVDERSEWEFRLEPAEGVTLVTHTLRWSPGVPPGLGRRLGFVLARRVRRNGRAMLQTLRNLAELAGTPPPSGLEIYRGVLPREP